MSLPQGQDLRSHSATYRIDRQLGSGSWAIAHLATVTDVRDAESLLTVGQQVVVKIPRLDLVRFTPTENKERLRLTHESFELDYKALSRLRDLESVASPLDYGAFPLDLGTGFPSPSLFVVSKWVDGSEIDQYMASHHGVDGEFRGLRTEESFFHWATELTRTVRAIHERMVIHGDLWPKNIMVDRRSDEMVIIDFGQA